MENSDRLTDIEDQTLLNLCAKQEIQRDFQGTKVIIFSACTIGHQQHSKRCNTFSYTDYFLCLTVLSNSVLDRTIKHIVN